MVITLSEFLRSLASGRQLEGAFLCAEAECCHHHALYVARAHGPAIPECHRAVVHGKEASEGVSVIVR
jgi:hypothetical protein